MSFGHDQGTNARLTLSCMEKGEVWWKWSAVGGKSKRKLDFGRGRGLVPCASQVFVCERRVSVCVCRSRGHGIVPSFVLASVIFSPTSGYISCPGVAHSVQGT